MLTLPGMLWMVLAAGIFTAADAPADAPVRGEQEAEEALARGATLAPPEEEAAPPEREGDGTGGAGMKAQDAAARPRKLDALGVPLLSYNSDLGWGIGLVGGGYYYAPGYVPYQHSLAAQTYFTTGGAQNHWLRYDGPGLLAGARLEVRLEHRRELFAPFYGAGNRSAEGYEAGVTGDREGSFDQLFPGGWARVRKKPGGPGTPFEWYAGYGFSWVQIRTYEGSALQREAPRGMDGGAHGRVLFGLLHDTRDQEGDPTSGGMEEVSLRLSGPPFGSRYGYGGVTLTERRFFSLGTPRLILAQRLVLDVLFGDVPFFEWAQLGGTLGSEGIGGMSSVRGVPRNRYQGTIKAFSNTELRFYVFDFPLFGEPVKFGGVAFWDMGRVWHRGTDDGPWHLWHPGVGGGLRLARRAAVIRFDYAVAVENMRQGIYVTFGHMF